MELICHLTDLQGRVTRWEDVASLEVRRSRETPADSLEVRGYLSHLPENYRQAVVTADGVELFRGRVDRQETSLSGKGTQLLLECRSLGGMMIDNEAPPREYLSIGGTELFQEHLAPFGFSLGENLPKTRLSSFKVTAGLREWEVFVIFCLRAYGKTPYADRSCKVWLSPKNRLVKGEADCVMEITQVYQPCKTISHIYVRDRQGYYTARAVNPRLQDPTLIRRRFIVPNPQYTGTKYGNAYERMTDSLRETFRQEVVFSGVLEIEPGDRLALSHPWASKEMNLVEEVTYRLGENGLTTRVAAVRPEDSL